MRASSRDGPSTGTKCCEGMVPSKLGLKDLVLLMWKYGIVSGDKNYMIKDVSNSSKYNLYAKTCICEGIFHNRKKSPGVCCDECNDLWKIESSNIKSWLQNRGGKFKGAERVLNTPVLSEEYADTITRFSSTPIKWINKRGFK